MNKVILIGNLANDPELKYTPSGVAVSTFRVAVSRTFTNAQGEREADFIDVVAWRQSAEFAANYLGKGRLVAVEGRLQIRSYQAQDGTRRRVAEVVADHLKALDRPRDGGDGGGGGHAGPGHGGAPSDDVPPYDDPFQDE
ncbi:MAG: single-stranded DNA-binding protein [Actinomycetota bacterium]